MPLKAFPASGLRLKPEGGRLGQRGPSPDDPA
jgi:hypothetical protein